MEWLAKQHEAASRRALALEVAEERMPVNKNGKTNIVNCMEEEQSYKLRGDPLVEKVAMAI